MLVCLGTSLPAFAGKRSVPCECCAASSAFDFGRARADAPPSLSTSAGLAIDPDIDAASASSSSFAATSSSASASSSFRRAVSRFAFANAARRPRSADDQRCCTSLLSLLGQRARKLRAALTF